MVAIFLLDIPDKDGITTRNKLEKAWESSGRKPEGLNTQPIPECAMDAWTDWLDLHQGRSSNGMAPAHLSWLDLDAWCRLRHRRLTKTSLDLIRTIDRAFLEAQNPKEK